MSPITAIERAFQLAESGLYRDVASLTKALSKEGYTSAESHLRGPAIRKQLREKIATARLGDEF